MVLIEADVDEPAEDVGSVGGPVEQVVGQRLAVVVVGRRERRAPRRAPGTRASSITSVTVIGLAGSGAWKSKPSGTNGALSNE